LKVWQSSNICN